MIDMTTEMFIGAVVAAIFLVDLGLRWWRGNAWRRQRRRRDDE